MQNEYSIWVDEDRHNTRAYKILLNQNSIRISRNLGRKKRPHQDDLCLDCHADTPPPDKRRIENNAFRSDDGVGCEACHGGAERYLRPHDSGSNRVKNIKLGMYPTNEPIACFLMLIQSLQLVDPPGAKQLRYARSTRRQAEVVGTQGKRPTPFVRISPGCCQSSRPGRSTKSC